MSESSITDHERLNWLIARGAYGLVNRDEYFGYTDAEIQHEVRKRIDDFILKENALRASRQNQKGGGQ